MLALSLGQLPMSTTGTTSPTPPSGTAPILSVRSVVSRLRLPVSTATSAGTTPAPTTGYTCTDTTCKGYGDTAALFTQLQSLLNQAVLHVGDVGQPPPVGVSGTIDAATVQTIWWLHDNTYPGLFPELNAAGAVGTAQWIADNSQALIADLQTFLAAYTYTPPVLTSGPISTSPVPTNVMPPGTPDTSSAPGCPEDSAWDPTTGQCGPALILPPNAVPPLPVAPAKLQPSHTVALTIGGIAAGIVLALLHR